MSQYRGIEVSSEDPAERFEFLSKVGGGSYGSVYRAHDRSDGTIVAIKVLDLSGEGASDCSELQKEINILKNCQSPYIVAYKGSFFKDGKLWIVMEYCGAGSLSDLMAICDITLTEAQIAAVMKQSLQGLTYLHSHKKIHRDIKSGNILLTHNGECKLADFGVSAELTTTLAKRATMIGTPYFMAPEVLQASQYDAKADIWSLAITAYELAIGQPPLANMHPMRAIFYIPTNPPPTLPNPEDFSAEFNDFLKVCLQMQADKRPSAMELLQHPFIRDAKEKAEIVALLEECMKVIEDFREAEAREQLENNENAPSGDPELAQTEDDDSGTMVQRNPNTQQSGTIVGPSASTWNGPDDGTVVVKASQLAGFGQQQAASNNNNASGTIVVGGGSSGAVGDTGTVLIRSTGDDHFGTIKVLRQEKKGSNNNSGNVSTNNPPAKSVNNNDNMGTIIMHNPTTTAGTNSAVTSGINPDVPGLNLTRAQQVFATLTPSTKAQDLQQAVAQLNRLYVEDQQALAAYYQSRQQKINEWLKK